jgi:ligand-binding sensor domain-containing protein/signal transduction histidine kinase
MKSDIFLVNARWVIYVTARWPRKLSGLALIFLALNLPAADLPMRGYYFEKFTVERGLPQNTVDALLQTRDGYLWIVTPFGLARFDGVSFKTFTIGNTPGLREDMFTSLAEDTGGILWAGTRDGLLRYENSGFELIGRDQGLPDSRIDALCTRRAGGVWVGTSGGLAYADGRRATAVATNENVAAVFEDSHGRVWFSVDKAIYRFDPTTSSVEKIYDKIVPGRTSCFCEHPSGSIWFGTRDGLCRWQESRLARFVPEDHDSTNAKVRVDCLMSDPVTGGLWVGLGNDRGLHLFKDGEWLAATRPNWPALRRVRRCLIDAEGNLWFGTETDGLVRLRPPRLRTFSSEDGLPGDCIWSACSSRDGGVWVGGAEGFSRIKDGHVSPFHLPEHGTDVIVRSVLEGRSGRLWIGEHMHRICAFEGRLLEPLQIPGLVKALYEDRSGTLWVGTSQGIARLRDGRIHYYTTEDGLSYRDVRAFLEDRNGALWIGTAGGGINVLSNGIFRVLDGFSSRKAWSFHEDADGVMWVGTDTGLNRYERGRVFVFTRKHGLFDDFVNHLVEDDFGMFWISCNRGIYRVSRKGLNEVAAGRARTVNHVAYGEADGMITSETNGENQPAGCKAMDGTIWFPTQRGVVVIDPKNVYRNELPPPVIVEQVIANDRAVFGQEAEVKPAQARENQSVRKKPAPIHLAPGEGRVLEIRYTANSFVDPAKMRFKRRLVGYDAEWHDAGATRVVYYTNLRPGRYRFEVSACNNHGFWNERAAKFPFVVEPHFYQTWPFYGLCIAGFVLSAASVQAYRLRVQRKFLGLEQQAALQRERARIAQDMHDDVGANLTKIAILSELAKGQCSDPLQLHSTAETISEMARKVIDNISEIVWVTNPRNDTLDNLAGYLRGYAAEFFEATPVICRFEFPESLPPVTVKGELRRDVMLVFKEALNNVARHSGATEVTVVLQVEKGDDQKVRLTASISDNGKGLKMRPTGPSHNGLYNIRDRITRRGGAVKIEPLAGHGTRVELSVELEGNLKEQPTTLLLLSGD